MSSYADAGEVMRADQRLPDRTSISIPTQGQESTIELLLLFQESNVCVGPQAAAQDWPEGRSSRSSAEGLLSAAVSTDRRNTLTKPFGRCFEV